MELQYKTEDSWIECFSLSAEDTNFAIPSVAYLGLSAETGELSDSHDIISIKAENLYWLGRNDGGKGSDSGRGKGRSSSHSSQEKSGSSWSWFFFKVILFFGAIAGAYLGWTIYRTKARSSRF